MRRSTLLVAAGLAAFLLFLVAFLPASVLLRFLPPEVALEGVSGTVWRGRAQVVRFRDRSLGQLEWSSRPWRLLVLELAYATTLRPAGGEVSLDFVTRSPRRLTLRQVRGGFPVAVVQGLISPAGWTGSVELDVDRLVLEDGFPTEAEGRVLARNLAATGPQGMAIGSFELTLGAGAVGGEGISGRLQDLGEGPMRVRASLDLRRDRSYTISGEVAASQGASEAVQRSLAFLGPPDSLGRRPLTIEGTL